MHQPQPERPLRTVRLIELQGAEEDVEDTLRRMEHERLMVHLPEVMPKLSRKEAEVIQLRFYGVENQPEKREVC